MFYKYKYNSNNINLNINIIIYKINIYVVSEILKDKLRDAWQQNPLDLKPILA